MPVQIDIGELADPFDVLDTKERAGYYAAMVDKYSRLQRLENERHAARTQAEKDAIEIEIASAHGVTISAEAFKRPKPVEPEMAEQVQEPKEIDGAKGSELKRQGA